MLKTIWGGIGAPFKHYQEIADRRGNVAFGCRGPFTQNLDIAVLAKVRGGWGQSVLVVALAMSG